MEEKILQTKKNGMTMLLLTLLGYLAAVVVGGIGFVMLYTTFLGFIPLAIAVIYAIIGIFLFAGLKVLKPEEALVLTLFGDYIGTLKGEGFYWVNPFCTAVNPAAGTVLSQSGDVQQRPVVQADREKDGKKISLKVMTLNNSRQKINDCLGNPVEIGIAVIWRVTDTAKAVFNVDNYKEYLSLQCDSALRNVVRIYPYDVAPNVDTTGDGVATRAACAALRKWWQSASRARSRRTSPPPGSRSSKPASLIWPTPPRSRRSCCSVSRQAPSLMPVR